MAQTTTNYGLFKPEATDTYNHLVYDNPNMDTIDAAMKNNSDHGVDNASCIKSGTVHSVTRTNTSCPVFKFTATGDWNTGDTMNVDGTPVSVYLPNGTAPLTGCFVINTEVMAIIAGSRVTLMCPVIPDASDISFDPTGTTLLSNNVEGALNELNDASNIVYDTNDSVKDVLDKFYDSTLTTAGLSPSGNVTINAGGYKQIGKFVYVNMTVTITSLSQWSTAISGFPKSKKEAPLSCCIVEPSASTNIMLDMISVNLRLATNSISSTTKINVNGVYLME